MELMGLNDINHAMRIDAPTVTTECGEFVTDNEFGYYVLCNTWLFVVKEYSEYGWMHVADYIHRKGLIATIKVAQNCADELINNNTVSDTLFHSIWEDVKRVTYNTRVPSNNKEIGTDPFATMLMVLRYPKRFSPVHNDKIKDESIKKFIEVENRTKLLQRRGYSQYILKYVKDVASKYLNWNALIREMKESIANNSCEFTSGVGFDSKANIGSKLRAISSSFPEYFIEPFGISYTGAYINISVEWWGKHRKDTVRAVKVQAVPKSYKASRIIAMEDTARQARAKALFNILDKYLPDTLPIHDQSVNQRLACYGSITGRLATLDLSNASDCISKALFREIFPEEFVELVTPFLGTHLIVNGKSYIMQQLSTAGNALTFALEGMTFDIIDRAAVEMLRTWDVDVTTEVEINGRVYKIPSVYGDDQVVASEAAELSMEMLKALGFIVNEAKSFTMGDYRESCGAEFVSGTDVSSYYFPRFPLLGSITKDAYKISNKSFRDSFKDVYIDTMTSLISLQHRLYGVTYGGSRFILEIVKCANPKMTSSFQGSSNSDLWDYDSTYSTRVAPMATFEDVDGKYLPRKRRLKKVAVEFSSVDAADVVERRYKSSPSTKYELKDKKVSEKDIRLFNSYKYRQFLEHGPVYSEPILRLLGVTDAPIRLEQAYGELQLVWGLHETDEK
jgi:hypothetical protein